MSSQEKWSPFTQIVVYHIDSKLWHRAVHKNRHLQRCGHSAVRFGESILILGGYRETACDAEAQDSQLDTSMTSTSRIPSGGARPKVAYFKLDEVISVEIGHHVGRADQNLSQMWELENKRSKSLDEVGAADQRVISSIKDYIFQWNISLFPSDQLSNQVEALQSLQKSSLQAAAKERDSLHKMEDPFEGLNEED